jgi:carbon-monoxide dehydrogenase small subunit
MSEHEIRLRVNGQEQRLTVPAEELLIATLREGLGLTGTKLGCAVGVCGACTVLLDGQMVSACLLPTAFAADREVLTIEGLAGDGRLSPVQQAFVDEGGFQCGICTPGQVLAATALLEAQPQPTDDEIRTWMTGNLCRCTGYYRILESVRRAAELNRAAQEGATVAAERGATMATEPGAMGSVGSAASRAAAPGAG